MGEKQTELAMVEIICGIEIIRITENTEKLDSQRKKGKI